MAALFIYCAAAAASVAASTPSPLAVPRPPGPTDLSCGAGCGNGTVAADPIANLTVPAPVTWEPLPLGSIAPSGWLLEQLLVQANALSGFMPTSTFPGAADVNQSQWINRSQALKSGTTQWLPYWSNGNVPLILLLRAAGPAATSRLDPASLEAVVDSMMGYVLAHTNKTNGWIGPFANEPGDANGHGLWDPLNMLRSLLMYQEAEPKVRKAVAKAVVAHLTEEALLLKTDQVYKWASTRWPTFVQVCFYVIDHLIPVYGGQSDVMPLGKQGTTKMLMDASRLFRSKGMDWLAYYNRTGSVKFPFGSVNNWNTNDHGVNNAEGALAWPAIDARLGGTTARADEKMALVLRMIDTYQAQPNALLCADEVFCGRAPHRGTETCAVVESMASLEQAYSILGDPMLMDRVETLAFNALPAALTADMWTHVYVQQANSVFAGDTGPKLPADVDPSKRAHHLHYRHQPNEYRGGAAAGSAACPAAGASGGWPKFAASAIMVNQSANSFVIASLVPTNATLPSTVGGGATVVVDSSYPFADNATIQVDVPAGQSTTMYVRIPGWATASKTTVDGKPAKNGTLVAVACGAGTTRVAVVLGAAVRVERGWGVTGERAASPVKYASGIVELPTSNETDWDLQGGAGYVGSRAGGKGGSDIRSGNAGGTSMIVSTHPLYGLAHNVTAIHASFTYVAGYTPPPGVQKQASTVSIHLLDMVSGKDIGGGALLSWPPLGNYSFDHFTGYSPPQAASVTGLSLLNAKPLLLAIQIDNHDRNLQIPLSSIKLSVEWTPTATPGVKPSPISPFLAPPADAAIVRRGPLLFALHPTESVKVVRSYEKLLPARPHAVDYEISTADHWQYALELPATEEEEEKKEEDDGFVFDPTPSSGWSHHLPFSTDDYPFSIEARAWKLDEATWGYWSGSKITAQPPPSPLELNATASGQKSATTIRMVPFGGTNIRISVMPWVKAP